MSGVLYTGRTRRLLFPSVIFALLSVAIPVASSAQAVASDTSKRIVAIVLDRNNVFVGHEGSIVGTVGDALHTTTKAPFIRAEFLFHVGDEYDSARVAQSARNLRALGVFSFVAIDSVRTDSGLVVRVHTQDGWSQQLITALRSTGGSTAWTLGLKDLNLLGTTTLADAEFHHTPDRDFLVFLLHRDRLLAGKIGATAEYISRSDGSLASLGLTSPWYSNEQRNGMTVTTADDREQILRYRDGESLPYDTLVERYIVGRLDVAHAIVAARDHYLRIGGVAQVRRDDFAPAMGTLFIPIAGHTVTGALGAYVEDNVRDHHVVVHNFQAFGRPEDVDLSTIVRVTAFVAPSALGYDQDNSGIGPGIGVHTGFTFPGGFAYQDLVADGLYGGAGLDSGQVVGATTIGFMPLRRHQLIVHAEAGALKNPVPGSEFDLGLGEGPRAFLQHAFTGDREFFVTADYRFAFAPNLFKVVGLGFAAFGDYGGAWFAGSQRRTGWDAGVGLRLAFTQDVDFSTSRFDLAWRGAQPGIGGAPGIPGGWVFTFVRGFPFANGARGSSR